MEIGKTNYGPKTKKEFPKKNYHPNPTSGDNFYSILPPVGSLAAKGEYAVRYKVHYGFRGPAAPGDDKGRLYLFVCPERSRKNKKNEWVVVVPCDECNRIRETKALLENQMTTLKEEGKTDAEIATATAPLQEFISAHNLSDRYHVNAVDMSGKIGLLRLPNSCIKGFKGNGGLENELRHVIETYGVEDPIGAGVVFNFKRNGSGQFGTTYETKVVTEGKQIPGVKTLVPVPRTTEYDDAFKARWETEAFDLGTLYTALTSEEVAKLVAADYDPEMVADLFATKRGYKKDAEEESGEEEGSEEELTVGTGNNFVVEELSEAEAKARFGM